MTSLKKLQTVAAAFFLCAALKTGAQALVKVYGSSLVDSSAVTLSTTYPLALTNNGEAIQFLSFQVFSASATVANTTFNDASIAPGSAVITATNTFSPSYPTSSGTLGLPVLFTRSGAFSPSPLVVGTTYYAIPVNKTSFSLATTSTGAVAGVGIVLTSSGTGNTFTLAPLAITGNPSFKWQVSNDGPACNSASTWTDLAVSSVTFSPYVFAGSTTIVDFGNFDYACIRANVVGPLTGGVRLKITGNGTAVK